MRRIALTIVLLLVASNVSWAEDDSAELAKKLQNPVASLISVPFQSNFEWGAGRSSDGFKYTLNVQPVIPIPVSNGWNVISRTIAPIIRQDDLVPDTVQFGLGDVVQSLFLSPNAPGPGGIIWGAGPVFLLPTATEEFLGGEKLGIGPTAVVLPQAHGFTGGLANHLVSVAGTSHTRNVNTTPSYSHSSRIRPRRTRPSASRRNRRTTGARQSGPCRSSRRCRNC